MGSLADTLERFSRKERNLLIRDILGHVQKPPRLSDDFRERLRDALGWQVDVPDDAWWATDYHFDWLAGALLVFVTGRMVPEGPNSGVVKGTQEDVDLVVASGEHL